MIALRGSTPRRPRRPGHPFPQLRQLLGGSVDDVDRQLGDVVEGATHRGQRRGDVRVRLLHLRGQVTGADRVALGVAGDLPEEVDGAAAGGDGDLDVVLGLGQPLGVEQLDGHGGLLGRRCAGTGAEASTTGHRQFRRSGAVTGV